MAAMSQSTYEVVDMTASTTTTTNGTNGHTNGAVEKRPGPQVLAMPPAPAGDWWDETQWAVLMSLLDAIVTPVVPDDEVTDKANQKRVPAAELDALYERFEGSMAVTPPSREVFRAYLAERPSENPAFGAALRRILSHVPDAAKKQLGTVLTLLSKKPGAFILAGNCAPVHQQPLHAREAIVRSWQTSWVSTMQVLANTLTFIGNAMWLQTSPLYRAVSGYPEVPLEWEPVEGPGYSFLQFGPGTEPAVLETDVVIVGSGCGGGVCAQVLAEAGQRVLVVDKGYYFPPSQLPMPAQEGMSFLYEGGGAVNSVDGSTGVVAGACWGGGGTVNWSVALQTQGYVRREWARDHGLPFFETQSFQDCLDRVCAAVGATTEGVRQSHRGQVLLDGAHRLGYEARPLPQNCGGDDHYDGHCHFGCGSARKRGPAVSFLPAAAAAGARFVEGFRVDRVAFDDPADKTRATGVRGVWTARDADGALAGPASARVTREVIVHAKKVIVASGSLNSPLLLTRSGLKNRHIGRNLHLHPVNFLGAYYKEDIRPWEGGIITSICSSFENLDNNGHGTKLETMVMLPGIFMPAYPWRGGLDFKLAAARFRHMAGFISLTRDRDTGRVYADPGSGRAVVDYTPSAFDRAHTLTGIAELAKLCYVTGAVEIVPFLPGIEPFVRGESPSPASKSKSETTAAVDATVDPGVADPAFAAWLDRLRRVGNGSPGARFASAHQMGTCRMSSHEGAGVVDPRGRVWGARDLYVADASVFPSASGVNPMITNMAIADWIARGVAAEMAKAGGGGGGGGGR